MGRIFRGQAVRGTIRLKHLNASGRFPSGHTRYYYRPKGKKGIPMPDFAREDPRFLEAYARAAAAIGGVAHGDFRPGTIGAGARAYMGSAEFGRLTASTRAYQKRGLDQIAKEYGSVPLSALKQKHIRSDLARREPNPANMRLRCWKAFLRWCTEFGMMDADPSYGIRKRQTETVGHKAWPRIAVANYRRRWAIGTRERLAMALLFWTGARASDAVRLGPKMIEDGWLTFNQVKTGGLVVIPMTMENAPAYSEPEDGLADLLAAIEALPPTGTFLATQAGEARSHKAVSQWFSATCDDGLTAHGLRKLRAAIHRENGANPEQRGAWLGHTSLSEVEHYGRSADLKSVLSGLKGSNTVPSMKDTSFKNKGLR